MQCMYNCLFAYYSIVGGSSDLTYAYIDIFESFNFRVNIKKSSIVKLLITNRTIYQELALIIAQDQDVGRPSG